MTARIPWRNLYVKTLFIGVFFTSLTSCTDVESPSPSDGTFYPIEMGMTWIYEVDSIEYDPFTGDSSIFHFEQKEEVTDQFNSADSQTTVFIITLSTRKTTSHPWIYHRTCTKSADDYRAVRNDFNLPRVKLVFPIKDKKSWDQNQLNINDEYVIRYRKVNEVHEVNGQTFSKTLLVDQEDVNNTFETSICWEIYADNVGLVEKNYTKTTGELDKKEGVSYRWRLISFTK